jgi:hypothetical protein
MKELKGAFNNILQTVDLSHKVKDFEHLVFQKDKAQKILYFKNFVKNM